MAKADDSTDLALGPKPDGVPIYRWLHDELREAILHGRVRRETRLPSSRTIAEQYRIARGTVVAVFEQLTAEGYLETRVGAGSYVRSALPERFFESAKVATKVSGAVSRAGLSER